MSETTRRVVSVVLVVLASISALVGALGVWTNDNIFDSERFAAKGTEVLADPTVTKAVSRHLSDQVFGLLENASGRDLSGRLGQLARANVERRVDTVFQGDSAQRIVNASLLRTHQALVRSIQGESNPVALNLLPIATEILNDLKADSLIPSWARIPQFEIDGDPLEQTLVLGDALRIAVPQDFGQIVLIKGDPPPVVQQARSYIKFFHQIVFGAIVAAIVLAAAAIAVSPRRARTLIHLGVGTAIAWVLGVVAVDLARSSVVGLIKEVDRDAVAAALRLFLATWTELNVNLVLVAVVLGVIGLMLSFRSGVGWISVLSGLAMAAFLGLTPVALLAGTSVTVVLAVLLAVTDDGKGKDQIPIEES